MNDIRNLMDNLHTQLEYKEFDTAVRAPADSWAVLERINRAAAPVAAPAAVSAPAPAPVAAPMAAPEPVAAAIFPAARADSAPARRRSRSLLGRYGAPEPAEPVAGTARQLPLADVFARLERAGR